MTQPADRLSEGLSVLSLALQTGQRQLALQAGLSSMQSAILAQLASRPAGTLRVKELAVDMGVAQPTMTVSVTALAGKGLIEKVPDPADGRASRLKLTAAGEELARTKPLHTEQIQNALGSLGSAAQGELMVLLTATIRALQASGAIAPQRQCISCKYFRPHVHEGTGQPHHCAFVNAAFGNPDLRFQCGDHEAALPADQSANWSVFAGKAETLRATTNPN
jgi:DNA-binding MarR family transcriptional regulator